LKEEMGGLGRAEEAGKGLKLNGGRWKPERIKAKVAREHKWTPEKKKEDKGHMVMTKRKKKLTGSMWRPERKKGGQDACGGHKE
jgi:hypothetical protein